MNYTRTAMSPDSRQLGTPDEVCTPAEPEAKAYTPKYIPKRVFLAIIFHLNAVYGLYLAIYKAQWKTLIFQFLIYNASNLGINAGAHRLWSHRSYKAKLPLQLILVLFTTLAFEYSAIIWVRNHRSHHKFSDTDADPHNSKRGFFFSHLGWVLMTQHPDIKRKGQGIDVSDVSRNPLLKFQHDYFLMLASFSTLVLPTLIPLLWGESLAVAWPVSVCRYILFLHSSLSINSIAHLWGNKPYDKKIAPTQCTTLSIVNLGEAYHNYHHVFPFDYRAAELGNNKLNATALFIDFFVWLGWAYDVKTATDEMIQARMEKTGDGSDLWGQ